MINLTLSVGQTITLSLSPTSFAGNVGKIKSITWKTVSGNSTIAPSNNGMTAIITAASTPGVTIFNVGANTNMNLKQFEQLGTIQTPSTSSFNFPPMATPTLIFNQISVNVVQTRIDSTQTGVTTNLGVSAGSPRDQI